jgi:hypothetical protein
MPVDENGIVRKYPTSVMTSCCRQNVNTRKDNLAKRGLLFADVSPVSGWLDGRFMSLSNSTFVSGHVAIAGYDSRVPGIQRTARSRREFASSPAVAHRDSAFPGVTDMGIPASLRT